MSVRTEKKRVLNIAPQAPRELKRGNDNRTDFQELLGYLKDVSENLRHVNQFIYDEYNSHTINPLAHFSAWKAAGIRRKSFYNVTNGATTVTFESSVTDPFYIVLGEGRQRVPSKGYKLLTSTSDLTCDLSTSGPGGLDTGSIAVDSVYYLYGINDDNTPNVIASLSDPATGPTGYTYGQTMYLGAVSTRVAAATFSAFRSSGGRIVFDNPLEVKSHTGDTDRTALVFDGIPHTADFVIIGLSQSGTEAGQPAYLSGTSEVGNYVLHQKQNTGNTLIGEVPLFIDHTVYVELTDSANTADVSLYGWVENPARYT